MTSASGVDPQISVANARIQAHRVPRPSGTCRSIGSSSLVDDHTDRPRARVSRRARRRTCSSSTSHSTGRPPDESDRNPPQPRPLDDPRRRRQPPCGSSIPRVQFHNPVMFVVEVGAVVTTVAWLIQLFGGAPLGGGDEPAWFSFTVAIWLWLTVVFANVAEALAEGRGKAQADSLRSARSEAVAQDADGTERAGVGAAAGRRGRRRRGGGHPRRRHGDRGHRLGRRVGDHRRVGAGDPRVGRRPQRRHRRHPRAQRPDRRRDHPGARQELPRPDDLPGRGRRAP